MKGLQGKAGIVTGCGGGIGRAVSVRLAEEGVKLVLVDYNEVSGRETLDLVQRSGGEAVFVRADVSKEADVQEYVHAAKDTFGRIDLFHNNAGIVGTLEYMADYPVDMFDQVVAINQRGVFLGMKYVLKVMDGQQSGSIINTASIGAITGGYKFTPYVATKHAVLGLTKVAAIEYGARGIRVNAICPGPINTPMNREASVKNNPDNPQEYQEKLYERVPSRRFGEPEEVAGLVAFLASDEAAFINGAAITIDGAMTTI